VTEPFGYGRLLPAGLLREPVSSLKRADAVVLTHCDLQRSRRLEEIEEQIREKNAGLIIAKSIHQPVSIVFSNGKEIPAEQLAGKKVFAFCGIASPEDFFRTIENLAARIIGREIFDDHYHYSEKDISRICKSAADSKAALVITTEKDWTKITHLNLDKNLNFAYLRIKIHFIEGLEQLTDLIEKAFEGKISRSMNSP
jgi:tetraacyldisaccharide 4'-kinase